MNPESIEDQILLVGLNHRFASIELREKLAVRPERFSMALAGFKTECGAGEAEFVLLSTCNRTEVYACGFDPDHLRRCILRHLAGMAHLSLGSLEASCYGLQGEQAALHLLRVAAGLDSLVIGEHEILGQVRRAFVAAQEAGACGTVLSALLRSALQTGKRVRSETEIGLTGLSIANVVVELAQETMGPLNDHSALLIGAGKISSMAARALTGAGLHCILVANRTYERAQKLAEALGGQAVHFEKLAEKLQEADIVICSTGAPHIVLHTEAVQQTMEKRPAKPLLIADLAVPRDADPHIADIPNVTLRNVDDLDEMVRRRHPMAAETRRQAESVVARELECFLNWLEERRNAALIGLLQDHTNAIVQAQLKKTLRRLGQLSNEQREALDLMGKAITSQFLHEPIRYLKTAADQNREAETEALISDLFRLK